MQTTHPKSYYSKLLLFGEHTILKGSQALAVPLPNFLGHWEYVNTVSSDEAKTLQQKLPNLLDYLVSLNEKGSLIWEFDQKKFQMDLEDGIFFKSNIPTGYGLGSSGALCAAIFDRYAKKKVSDLVSLKKIFGQMESFFHGASSGVDPLICYLHQPLLFQSKEKMFVTSFPSGNQRGEGAIFLLDTQISRETGPLVQVFLTKCEDESFGQLCQRKLIPEVNHSIKYLLNAEWSRLSESFHKISTLQAELFQEMIPKSFKNLWMESLKQGLFHLKLCGAGGGGFILGMTKDWSETKHELSNQKLIPVFRF